jgi:uncharacterized protein YdaU (DUF1376 family)
MAREPFLPLFVGDFLSATEEWPGEAQGLYLALLARQWVNPKCSLPANPESLRALVKWNEANFERYWSLVREKFELRGDRLANRRLEEHRARSIEISRQNSAAGRLGAQARRQRALGFQPSDATADAKPNGGNPVAGATARAEAFATENGGARLSFAQAPSHPIPSQSNPRESASLDSEGVSRARVGGDAHAAEDRARRLKKPIREEPGADELRHKALTLLANGNLPGDVARMLRTYGVTADQVSTWQREEAAHAGG